MWWVFSISTYWRVQALSRNFLGNTACSSRTFFANFGHQKTDVLESHFLKVTQFHTFSSFFSFSFFFRQFTHLTSLFSPFYCLFFLFFEFFRLVMCFITILWVRYVKFYLVWYFGSVELVLSVIYGIKMNFLMFCFLVKLKKKFNNSLESHFVTVAPKSVGREKIEVLETLLVWVSLFWTILVTYSATQSLNYSVYINTLTS